MDNIRIRPHHSLCIQFFVGEGYSREFVQSMSRVIQILHTENPIIELSDKCDVVCGNCPNNINGNCLAEQKVSDIDKRCLAEYGLAVGDKIRWHDLEILAYQKIIRQHLLPSVCRNCQWNTICFDKAKNACP